MEQREISNEHTLCARAIYHPIQAQAISATEDRIKTLKTPVFDQSITCMTNRFHRQIAEQELKNLQTTPPHAFRKVQEILSTRDQTLFSEPKKYESDMLDLSIMLKDPTGELIYTKWFQARLVK